MAMMNLVDCQFWRLTLRDLVRLWLDYQGLQKGQLQPSLKRPIEQSLKQVRTLAHGFLLLATESVKPFNDRGKFLLE